MKEVHLQDEPSIYNLDGAELVVSKYISGDYEGHGDALILRKGNVEYYNLGHCSCYGPFDGTNSPDVMTIDQFKEMNNAVTTQWPDDLATEFLKLI